MTPAAPPSRPAADPGARPVSVLALIPHALDPAMPLSRAVMFTRGSDAQMLAAFLRAGADLEATS